jgi:hypothetical protein
MNYLNYIKWGVITIALCALIWIVKDYNDKAEFKKDTEQNAAWEAKFDSLRISYTVLTDKQMIEHIKEKKELKTLLKENGIREARVTSIMNHLLRYRDTTIVETNLSPVLDAINKKESIEQPFIDSTACLVNKGIVKYENGLLSLIFKERLFQGETTAVAYWEKNKWRIPVLGIKTRLFGKTIGTAKIIDKCGESTIINIEKSK